MGQQAGGNRLGATGNFECEQQAGGNRLEATGKGNFECAHANGISFRTG